MQRACCTEVLDPLPHTMLAPPSSCAGTSLTEQLGARSSCRYLQEQDEAAARQRFERQASRLHHLVSTSAIPSIYASPYAVLTGSIPLVEGVPLEEHIRTLSKGLVRHLYTFGGPACRVTCWSGCSHWQSWQQPLVAAVLCAACWQLCSPATTPAARDLGALWAALCVQETALMASRCKAPPDLKPLHGCSAAARPAAGPGRDISCHR